MNRTKLSKLNFRDNLSKISKYNLLRKTENSIEQLQSIESFILSDDKEKNSFSDISC